MTDYRMLEYDKDILIPQEKFDDMIRGRVPFHSDDTYRFYDVDGKILVASAQSAAPDCFAYVKADAAVDRAVREAGFATEPLRHLVEQLYQMLYLRMLNDPVRGFTNMEWEVCCEAREVLGLAPAHRAPDEEG